MTAIKRSTPDTIAKDLQRDKMILLIDAPFFGVLLARLNLVQDHDIPTAATDGKIIKYNPHWFCELTPNQRRFVLAHEVMHPALGHIWRCGHRDPELWNIACDIPINHTLKEYVDYRQAKGKRAVMELPDCGLFNDEWAKLSAERIYTLLPKNSQPTGGQFKNGNGDASSIGELIPQHPDKQGDEDGDGDDSASSGETGDEVDWKLAATQAAIAEKAANQGQLPGNLDRLIGELLEPDVDWIHLLREFVSAVSRNDYSFTRPNRRHVGRGFCLPTLHSESFGEFVVVVDTSGSIDLDLLTKFLSETQAILDTCSPEKVHIIDCDYSVHRHVELYPGDSLADYQPIGGGGTSFIPPFRLLEEKGIEPKALIYFTDLYGSFPSEPDYPTLWLTYGNTDNAPFGTTVHIQ